MLRSGSEQRDPGRLPAKVRPPRPSGDCYRDHAARTGRPGPARPQAGAAVGAEAAGGDSAA